VGEGEIMLVVGERINGTRKKIAEAIAKRDAAFIRHEARRQTEAGANYLDINAGTVGDKEIRDMQWLVETVRAEVSAPLCIDSPNPSALQAGLRLAGSDPMVNSITGETGRFDDIAPVAAEFGARVVCLLMDDRGLLSGVDERVRLASDIAGRLEKMGIRNELIHFDPCVKPVSTDPESGAKGLAVVGRIAGEIAGAHTICGLSNVSFGLPERPVLNGAYVAMMIGAGLDSVIMDPLDKRVAGSLRAALALAGRDEMCMGYIGAAREGMLL
jgi:5-methyltetrahydrofolate--homocysteine methyltransferase